MLGSADPNTFSRELGLRLFNRLLSGITHQTITDCSNGYRAVRADALGDLVLRQEQFHASEFLIESVKRGLRLVEVPVTIARRARTVRPRRARRCATAPASPARSCTPGCASRLLFHGRGWSGARQIKLIKDAGSKACYWQAETRGRRAAQIWRVIRPDTSRRSARTPATAGSSPPCPRDGSPRAPRAAGGLLRSALASRPWHRAGAPPAGGARWRR